MFINVLPAQRSFAKPNTVDGTGKASMGTRATIFFAVNCVAIAMQSKFIHETHRMKTRSPATTVFAIDPGIAGTGYAVLSTAYAHESTSVTLVRAGNIYASNDVIHWPLKAWAIVDELESIVKPYLHRDTCEFVCEFPTYMAGMHVATAKDSTIKMAFICGMIARIIQPHSRYGLDLIIPTRWKGTMSKELVERRCRRHVEFDVRSHAIDAIGIGLHHLGEW